jgi:hypothetical protein
VRKLALPLLMQLATKATFEDALVGPDFAAAEAAVRALPFPGLALLEVKAFSQVALVGPGASIF